MAGTLKKYSNKNALTTNFNVSIGQIKITPEHHWLNLQCNAYLDTVVILL